MPPLQLPGGSTLRLEAISPTTGAAITGVAVSDVAVYGIDISSQLGTLLEDVIPGYTPGEVEGLG